MAKWSWTADFIQACNCDWGCPCNWSAPPTTGFCHGMGAWKIRAGLYDGLTLDGLHVAFAAKWPGQIHEGNGVCALYVDERADAAQRDALLRIVSGQAGGLPFEIVAGTFAEVLDPLLLPFDFRVDGPRSSVSIGPVLRVALEPIKSPVMGNPVAGRIVLERGFVFKEALVTSLDVFTVLDREVKFAYPGKNGHYAVVDYPY
jgi:hypothetical protein